MSSIVIAGHMYRVSQAIWWSNNSRKDKATMMFVQLVAAELYVKLRNDGSCINPTVAAADAWLMLHPARQQRRGLERRLVGQRQRTGARAAAGRLQQRPGVRAASPVTRRRR
jgi:hypothetical protein